MAELRIIGNKNNSGISGPLGPDSSEVSARMLTPERIISQESQLHYSVNRQLALSSFKCNTKTIKFDGKDEAPYSPWKVAIELEAEGLLLSEAEWLEILQLRTSSLALEIVKQGQELALVNPKEGLGFIWDMFNAK